MRSVSETPSADPDQQVIEVSALLGTLWRGKWIILAGMVCSILAGGYYAYRIATPLYQSTTVMMLDSREEQVVNLESVVGGLSRDGAVLNSELEVLRSRSLLGKVVDTLNLVADPEFNPTLRDPSLRTQVRTFIRDSMNAITLSGGTVAPAAPQNDAEREARTRVATINSLRSKMNVEIIPRSLVFEVKITTQDPRKSALIADTLVDLYILNQLDVKFEATEQATTWLTERVSELQGELETAEARVREFNANTDLISQEALAAFERQLKELRDRIQTAEATQQANIARLAAMEEATSPQEKAEAAGDAQLAAMLSRLGTQETVQRFDNRFQQLLIRTRQDVERDAAQLQALKNSETAQAAQISSQSADLITLQQYRREAEASRLLYEYFLSRLKETSATQGIQQADSRVLSEAVVASSAASPRKNLIIATSGVLGFLLGAALILLREMRSHTFRSAREMEQATRYPVMGQIPLLPFRRRSDTLTYLAEKPTSVYAEAVRNLRTSVLLSDIDHPQRVTMVTSSFPGEGKTTVAVALAHNLACMGKKVLLVEGDIRARVFSQFIKTDKKDGLVSVISGDIPLEEALITDDSQLGADILMGEGGAVNAADIFASERFKDFVETLRGRYDHVIIDTPPVLVVPDARVLAQFCDAILFVVKWDSTQRANVTEALHMFESVNIPVSGLVLNQINPKGMRRYGYGYGSYSGYGDAGKYYNN